MASKRDNLRGIWKLLDVAKAFIVKQETGGRDENTTLPVERI